MHYQIFTTCGTSVLTNAARGNSALSSALTKYSNVARAQEIPGEDLAPIQSLYEQQIDTWANYTESDVPSKSAELNCLLRWMAANKIDKSNCTCFLLHTDTYIGECAASLVQEWLKENGFLAELQRIESLNTLSLNSFEQGLSNFAQWAFENVKPVGGVKNVFNVAGGFKSVSGFAQVLGQFLADETIYIFDGDNTQVLSIPRMPVRWNEMESIRENINDYRKISLDLPVECCGKLNSLWVRNGKFTPWGRIAWEAAKAQIYSERLLPSISEKVVFGNQFAKSCETDDKRYFDINERIDDLTRFVVDRNANIRRLDYKPLKGKHPWSHECDAWADGSAKRIFCNDHGNYIVVEELHEALH
ncbi:MAG: putative CRISPR-associated protein [Fibrobacter sp.]|nr:putative CRISPR-associated protein [Fibrobacteraceae bacterium]MCF0225089.1 putative CRISPR-associated protein [Fibrobacter sp.]